MEELGIAQLLRLPGDFSVAGRRPDANGDREARRGRIDAYQPVAYAADGAGRSHGLYSRWPSTTAPSPGGCRCMEGGTPDPCPRDHPGRPGVKLEPPQAA